MQDIFERDHAFHDVILPSRHGPRTTGPSQHRAPGERVRKIKSLEKGRELVDLQAGREAVQYEWPSNSGGTLGQRNLGSLPDLRGDQVLILTISGASSGPVGEEHPGTPSSTRTANSPGKGLFRPSTGSEQRAARQEYPMVLSSARRLVLPLKDGAGGRGLNERCPRVRRHLRQDAERLGISTARSFG